MKIQTDQVKEFLSAEIKELIESNEWTQKEAAKHLGLTQPGISYIMCGRIDRYSIDLLIKTLVNAGYNIEISRVGDGCGQVSLGIKKKEDGVDV